MATKRTSRPTSSLRYISFILPPTVPWTVQMMSGGMAQVPLWSCLLLLRATWTHTWVSDGGFSLGNSTLGTLAESTFWRIKKGKVNFCVAVWKPLIFLTELHLHSLLFRDQQRGVWWDIW